MKTLKEFKKMVRDHDLTYSYSDDHRCYTKGAAEYDKILKEAKTLPRADVVKIWNAVVDKKLMSFARSSFYWYISDTLGGDE